MVLGEQVGDLDEVLDEGEGAHRRGQRLQAVHEVQGEPRRRAHRERDVAEHQQLGPVLHLADGDRPERDAVVLHVRAHRAGAVDDATCGGLASRAGCAAQAAQQPAQRLLELGPLVLVDPLGLGGLDLALLDLVLHRHQLLEVLLQPLGQAGQERRECGPQGFERRRREVLVHVGQRVLEPAEQCHLLGHGELDVELHAGAADQVAGGAGVVHPVRGDLHARGLAGAALGVVGEHDLVGQRGDVDLVGLLVEVVLLRHVLGLEELLDVVGLAVRVTVLGDVAGLVGQRELLELAVVGQVVVAVAVADLVLEHRAQPEEPVEDAVEGLQVAAVLDQADHQRGAEHLALAEHARLGHRVHGVDRLRRTRPGRRAGAAAG